VRGNGDSDSDRLDTRAALAQLDAIATQAALADGGSTGLDACPMVPFEALLAAAPGSVTGLVDHSDGDASFDQTDDPEHYLTRIDCTLTHVPDDPDEPMSAASLWVAHSPQQGLRPFLEDGYGGGLESSVVSGGSLRGGEILLWTVTDPNRDDYRLEGAAWTDGQLAIGIWETFGGPTPDQMQDWLTAILPDALSGLRGSGDPKALITES
jgi:hypothetical protein